MQFPVTYYFHNAEERFSLPLAMPYLLRLAEKTGGESFPPQVRLRARILRGAIGDSSNRIGSKAFLDLSEEASAEEVIEAYTRDHHLHERPRTVIEVQRQISVGRLSTRVANADSVWRRTLGGSPVPTRVLDDQAAGARSIAVGLQRGNVGREWV